MLRLKAFIRKAAKAVVGGASAGVAALVLYTQTTTVDLGSWEPYVVGAVVAFGNGFLVYWTTNAGAKPYDYDATTSVQPYDPPTTGTR